MENKLGWIFALLCICVMLAGGLVSNYKGNELIELQKEQLRLNIEITKRELNNLNTDK